MKFEQGYRITFGVALLASALCCMGQVVASMLSDAIGSDGAS